MGFKKYLFFSLNLVFSLFIFSNKTYALEQNEKLWVAINSQHFLSEDKKWLLTLYSQLRFINKSHPLQAGLIEGVVGYQFHPQRSVWVGYRLTGANPNNGFYQENRLIQQIILSTRKLADYQFVSRTRLEEIEHTNQSEMAFRLRQRVALELMYLSKIMHPFFYDEVFFQLNKTTYTTHQLISENRLFLGMNYILSQTTWWEIGYINQYQLSTPRSQNQMSHILSLTYNFN